MWLDTPSKEEQKIIDKYQKYTSRYNVLSIPLKYWDAFDELETIHKSYYELFQNHFDDLKYYALMYRDVELTNHIFMHDMYFFSERKDQIIGYKNRIFTDDSLKAQVVRLFYNNEPMFISFCCKILDISPWTRRPGGSSYNYERDYVAIKSGNLRDLRFCVDKLTEEQCKIIIKYKSEIKDCTSVRFKTFPLIQEKNDFIERFYIPCFFTSPKIWDFRRTAIINYINEKLPDEDLNKTITFSKEKVERILYLRNGGFLYDYKKCTDDEIKHLEEKMPRLRQMPQFKFKEFDYQYICEHYRIHKNGKYREAWEKEREEALNNHKIQCELIKAENIQITERINAIKSKIYLLKLEKQRKNKKEYNDLIEELLHESKALSYIYNNQHELNSYLNRYYDMCFKNYWLKDSDSCRTYFQFHDNNLNSFENFFEFAIKGSKYVDSEEYKSIKNKPFEQKSVDGWIRSVESYLKIIEEQERTERERKAELERIEYEKRMEKYRFNKRNSHERDKNIELRQSDHIYMVNGIALDSVTTFVNNAFPKFDAEFHAKRKAEQLGISPEEVLEMWEQKGKESRDLGTAMHSKIENYYLGYDSQETDAYKLFKMFADKIELKPYRTEWAVYDLKHNIAGTIDFVDYQNGEYIIYDWKRSEKIIENGMPVKINKYGEKGNYPLEHLDNTPYYHYALQLSLYKYILEKNYGMKISDLRLGIFHPSYNKPYVLRMPYLEKEINDIFSLRSEVIF